jgi:hypothetical protein
MTKPHYEDDLGSGEFCHHHLRMYVPENKRPSAPKGGSVQRASGAFAGVACVLTALFCPSAPAGDPQYTSDLAFDQIGKVLSKAPPVADNFAADLERAQNLPALPSAEGLYAASQAVKALGMTPVTALAEPAAVLALGAANKAYQADVTAASQAYREAGILTHAWFYRQWSRIDTPAMKSAVIVRPDQGAEIYLDVAARTYRRVQTETADKPAEVYVVSAADSVVFKFTSAPVFRPLEPMSFAGHPARGYRTDATFTVSAPLGFCSAGSHVLSEVEYVADVPDPQATGGTALAGSALAREACLPSAEGSHREPGRLVLFRILSVTNGPPYGDLANVLERGNLRTVDAKDASLFSAPPDFKEVP